MKKIITLILILMLATTVSARIVEDDIDQTFDSLEVEDIKVTPNEPMKYFFNVQLKETWQYTFANKELKQLIRIHQLRQRQLEYEVMANQTFKNKEKIMAKHQLRYEKSIEKVENLPITNEAVRERIQARLMLNLEQQNKTKTRVMEQIQEKVATSTSNNGFKHAVADDDGDY